MRRAITTLPIAARSRPATVSASSVVCSVLKGAVAASSDRCSTAVTKTSSLAPSGTARLADSGAPPIAIALDRVPGSSGRPVSDASRRSAGSVEARRRQARVPSRVATDTSRLVSVASSFSTCASRRSPLTTQPSGTAARTGTATSRYASSPIMPTRSAGSLRAILAACCATGSGTRPPPGAIASPSSCPFVPSSMTRSAPVRSR